jgi:hypothetical protein
MNYKKGHTIKPKETLENGVVVFTDGTSDVSPNQISCEAYGYKWDRKSSTCYGFSSNFKIGKLFQNTTNTKIGAENVTNKGTENTFINGTKNTTKGNNRNLLICGESHEVSNGISNASVFGTYGKALRQAEVVIGGGVTGENPKAGLNQTSVVQLIGATADATPTNLTIAGGSSTIAVQNNSILGFEAKVIGLVSGGDDGTAGNYKYFEITGAVKTSNDYSTAFSQSTATIANIGTIGTVSIVDVSAGLITVQVTGTANVNVEWFASVQLTENKLTSVTF